MSYKNFEKALEFLFPSEGGYSNHKNDLGGPCLVIQNKISFC